MRGVACFGYMPPGSINTGKAVLSVSELEWQDLPVNT